MGYTLEQVERLIKEINRVHEWFSREYFEIHGGEKIKLKQTISHIPEAAIFRYRLHLHESINDYLYKTDLDDVKYYYRVKTAESLAYKIEKFKNREEKYPVNKWLNDIFGCRIILDGGLIRNLLDNLDKWEEQYGLKNWYFREAEGYRGIHIYFKSQSNFYFPWELQIWDKEDAEKNIASHRLHKRSFVK
ncbi:MAG: hypothetical protein FWF59_13325 [Turicibacter sp.]|nr:hypothetical protein [Turicibacter sp.]